MYEWPSDALIHTLPILSDTYVKKIKYANMQAYLNDPNEEKYKAKILKKNIKDSLIQEFISKGYIRKEFIHVINESGSN